MARSPGGQSSVPGLGRSPGGGHGNPLQYSCLENLHGQRSLVGCRPRGHTELDTTKQLSAHNNFNSFFPQPVASLLPVLSMAINNNQEQSGCLCSFQLQTLLVLKLQRSQAGDPACTRPQGRRLSACLRSLLCPGIQGGFSQAFSFREQDRLSACV